MSIDRPSQVWVLDTTTIRRLAKGFAHPTSVIDWVRRKVLAAQLAITLEACHVIEVFSPVRKSTSNQKARDFLSEQSSLYQAELLEMWMTQSFHKLPLEPGGYAVSWNNDIDISEYELWHNAIPPNGQLSVESIMHRMMGT